MNKERKEERLKGVSILLAEDCFDQSRMYLKVLTGEGAKVTLDCNGQSACDTFTRSPKRYKVVILDFQMPELDGLETTRFLRSNGFEGPIIGITAFEIPGLEKAWLSAGCDTCLIKPFDYEHLVETVVETIKASKLKKESLNVSH